MYYTVDRTCWRGWIKYSIGEKKRRLKSHRHCNWTLKRMGVDVKIMGKKYKKNKDIWWFDVARSERSLKVFFTCSADCVWTPHTHTPPTPPAPDCSQSGSCSETPPLCLLSQAYLPAFSLSLYSCSLSLCFLTSRLPSCEGPSPRISQFVFEIVLHYGILSMRSEKSLSKCCRVCVFAHFLLIVCVCVSLSHTRRLSSNKMNPYTHFSPC